MADHAGQLLDEKHVSQPHVEAPAPRRWSLHGLLRSSMEWLLIATLAALPNAVRPPAVEVKSDAFISKLEPVWPALAIFLCGLTVVVTVRQLKTARRAETVDAATPTVQHARQEGVHTIRMSLLILAIVALGPAAHFILQFPSTTLIVGVAKIPLSTAFAASENRPGAVFESDRFLSITAVNAIYNGFFGSPAPFRTVCPSGNCAWDKPYTTLALCSSCTDLTSSLTPYTDSDGQEVGIQLPNGFLLRYNAIHQLPMGQRQFYSNMNSTAGHADSYPNLRLSDYSSIAYQDMPGRLHNGFVIVGSTPEIAVHMSEAPAPAAYECALQWCLQQSTAKMVNGRLNETVVNIINDTTVAVTDPRSILSRQLTDPATKQLYNVSRSDEYTLSNILVNLVNGSRNANVSGDAVPLTSLWNAVARPEKSPAELYEHLAYSLSTFMRVNNSAIALANYSTAEGVATSEDFVAQISWPWLAYPLLVGVSCGLYAFVTLRRTRSKRTGQSVEEEESSLLLPEHENRS